MRPLNLDARLSLAASLFPACAYGADIGADHGRLSCYLLETGKAARMCVADVSAPSLNKARELLALRGVESRADIRVGDGLNVLSQRADAIAILGMGGRTVSEILTAGKDQLCGATLILSAHTDMALLRHTLADLGYRIGTEKIALAANRFYIVMRAIPGWENMDGKQALLGPRLMEHMTAHYPEYLFWRIGLAAQKQNAAGRQELQWLREEYDRVCDRQNH